MKLIIILTVICSIISFVELAKPRPTKLPSYIEKCTFDETFNECFVQNGNKLIPQLLDGDKPFGIPSFRPFKLNEVIFEPSKNLQMHFTNLKVSGFDDAKILNAKFDAEKSEIYFELLIPHLIINADYTTKGRILVLPFEGNGPCKIELFGGIYKINTKFENLAKNSVNKFKVLDTNVNYTLEKTIYNFENLFNGNKRIGDETNRFLNENNKELYNDFQPAFSKTIEAIASSVMSGILGNLHSTSIFNFPE